ncbi:MAG TPA: FAD-dependent oxidoreductase [Methylomirabilota bacterium]|jgi:cation diffusion facilitator CzcD-associated flavoprotein CzcO|nr:FAD-dependent oxidoreductase [Methylomirabilota bacterium]
MSVVSELLRPPRPASPASYDAVVVGAGPYGLSTAAHLLDRGLRVAVFGRPLELWRRHMPRGMCLRSHWWATSLSDPARRFAFERFFAERGLDRAEWTRRYPLPIETFVDYALWFQRRAVPDVDATYVVEIERDGDHFALTLADGRRVTSAAVVMAIGVAYFAHRPAAWDGLPPARVSHSIQHADFARFAGQRVIVVGGGQSAVEYAALLADAGAQAHLVSRRPIEWLGHDRTYERSLVERVLAPTAGIAPGWLNLALERLPYLFYRAPEWVKDERLRTYYTATASGWLRDRVAGRVTLHEGRQVLGVAEAGDGLDAALSDGARLRADHVVLATGFKVDVARLPMLAPGLRAVLRTRAGLDGVTAAGSGTAPVLSPFFESSVPGLYFVGLTSMRAFGPLYRFVLGCGAAARRVTASIARAGVRA